MALPTGKQAVLQSIRAKANKAMLLATDADEATLFNLAEKLFAATDERIAKLAKSKRKAKPSADLVEEDIASE